MKARIIRTLSVLLGLLVAPRCTPFALLLLPPPPSRRTTSSSATASSRGSRRTCHIRPHRQLHPSSTSRASLSATRLEQNDDASSSSSSMVDVQQRLPPRLVVQRPNMTAFASGYKTVFVELPFRSCPPSIGTIPTDLVGSYFRAGPAMFSAGSIVPPKMSLVRPKQPPVPDGQDVDRMVRHPMEGDGAVFAMTFHGADDDDGGGGGSTGATKGTASARFRFVRTAGFTNERKKGARIYKALDDTRGAGAAYLDGHGNDSPLPLIRHHLQPGLNKQRKHTANTRAVYWGDRLFALWEGGQPYKLDARALDTEGRSQLGGAIKKDDEPFGGKLSYDSIANRAVFYAVAYTPQTTDVTLYEFDEKFALVERSATATSLPGYAAIADFVATRNYAVFVQPGTVQLNPMSFLLTRDPARCLKDDGQNQPGTVHLIPRTGSQKMSRLVSIQLPAVGPTDTNVHFVNAYEEGPSTVIVDVILSDTSTMNKSGRSTKARTTWPWATSLEEYQSMASKKSLWRYTIDTGNGGANKTLLMDDHHCLFGTINPSLSSQKHRYIYAACGALGSDVAPPQGILRFDSATGDIVKWLPEPYEFCGEPMYAPRQGVARAEDGGYILSLLYNGQSERSELVILHADDVAAGPVTRIPLNIAVPHGLFGCFAASAVWPADSLQRRAKLADKVESRGSMWNEVKSDMSSLGLRLDDMEEYFGDFFN